MDEIICPECGRPNLIEAEKCWYCQSPLVKNEDVSEELSGSDAGQTGEAASNNKPSASDDNEENLPEWLKRIRELKKADTPVEEVDEWQQEKLFPGLAPEDDGTPGRTEAASRPAREVEKPEPKPVIPEGQPMLDEALVEDDMDDTDEMRMADEGAPPDENEQGDPEDELPEGFTPL
jgi:hypothetical protein